MFSAFWLIVCKRCEIASDAAPICAITSAIFAKSAWPVLATSAVCCDMPETCSIVSTNSVATAVISSMDASTFCVDSTCARIVASCCLAVADNSVADELI